MHTIVPFVGLFWSIKVVLVNLFLVLCLIATAGGRGELVAFLVGGLGLYSFFNYLYNRARIRISLKLILKTVGAVSQPPLSFLHSCTLQAVVPGALI